jgi:hypothetical protein
MSSVCNENLAKVTQGEDAEITMRVLKDGEPMDLTAVTEITVKLPKDDGTAISKTLTLAAVVILGNPVLGKFKVILPDADTALLNAGELQDFEALIDVGATRTIVRFEKALTVLEALF